MSANTYIDVTQIIIIKVNHKVKKCLMPRLICLIDKSARLFGNFLY